MIHLFRVVNIDDIFLLILMAWQASLDASGACTARYGNWSGLAVGSRRAFLANAFWCVVQRLLVCCSAPVGALFCLGIGLSASNTEPVCTRCETHCSSLSQESENIPKRLRILVKSETKKSCPERYCLSKFAWKFVVGTRCHGQF